MCSTVLVLGTSESMYFAFFYRTSLVSPPIKLRKMMKHSDGCSSNSGSGSETSITDGMEPSLGLPTEETTRIRYCIYMHVYVVYMSYCII